MAPRFPPHPRRRSPAGHAQDSHNLKGAVGSVEDLEVLDVGSGHVAFEESTGAPVTQADGFP